MRDESKPRLCACGCRQVVTTRRNRFVNRDHWYGYLRDPKHARLRAEAIAKATRAAVKARRRKTLERSERFASKAEAYAAGYRVGKWTEREWWKKAVRGRREGVRES